MREVKLVMASKKIGWAYTWAYPDGGTIDYKIPTYQLKVIGINNAREEVETDFEVIRFGVLKKGKNAKPRVVGLNNAYTYPIRNWFRRYTVHSAKSKEKGAWQIWKNFLIHDGPDDPHKKENSYASIGCIEICNGPEGFNTFNDLIIDLAGIGEGTRNEILKKIGTSGRLTLKVEQADDPPLESVP